MSLSPTILKDFLTLIVPWSVVIITSAFLFDKILSNSNNGEFLNHVNVKSL